MTSVFGGLAMVLGLAAVGGVVARIFKQPAVVGYIVAGVVLTGVGRITALADNRVLIETMGQLGVTLLLFLVGLEMPIASLKKIGRTALVVGIGQIVVTAAVGMGLSRLLGFGVVSAIYIGIALTFGSTVIVINLLAAKRDLQSLYGRIAVGFLLVQDFVAIGILAILSGLSKSGFVPMDLAFIMVKAIVLVGVAMWLSEKVLPKMFDTVGKSTEVVLIAALAWCLVIAAGVSLPTVGFTVEIGGFLAGLALANAASNLQIIAKVRPLRDFFLTWFFVALGASIGLANLQAVIVPGVILAAFVLIGNPMIVMLILGVLGYKKRVAFLAAVTVAQVSEFSLVMLTLALKIGHIEASVLSLVGLVAVITMIGSTYLIMHAASIYRRIGKWIPVWERRTKVEISEEEKKWKDHIILFGHNRMGGIVRPVLEKLGLPVLVVDFDPTMIERLHEDGVTAVYGDIADYELYDEIGVSEAKVIVSTVTDLQDNLQLLAAISEIKRKRPKVLMVAVDAQEAEMLENAGADYVLVPHSVGGEYLAHYIGKLALAV